MLIFILYHIYNFFTMFFLLNRGNLKGNSDYRIFPIP
nr:MAG TPA: hypothetical protein [Caudoviricetes sp.]